MRVHLRPQHRIVEVAGHRAVGRLSLRKAGAGGRGWRIPAL